MGNCFSGCIPGHPLPAHAVQATLPPPTLGGGKEQAMRELAKSLYKLGKATDESDRFLPELRENYVKVDFVTQHVVATLNQMPTAPLAPARPHSVAFTLPGNRGVVLIGASDSEDESGSSEDDSGSSKSGSSKSGSSKSGSSKSGSSKSGSSKSGSSEDESE